MAGDNPVIGLDVEARLDQLRAELAKIPDIGAKEAKALTGALAKEFRGAERAAASAAKASAAAGRDATAGLKGAAAAGLDFQSAARAAAERTEKLAGAVGLVSPEAAKVVMGLGHMAKATTVGAEAAKAAGLSMAVLGGALAGVAAAIGVATFAWKLHAREVAAANAAVEQAKERQEALRPTMEATGDLLMRARVATGEVTEAEAKRFALMRAAKKDFEALNKADADRAKALEHETRLTTAESRELAGLRVRLRDNQIWHDARVAAIDELIAAEEKQKQRRERATQADRLAAEAQREGARAAEDLARAHGALGDSLPQRAFEDSTARLAEWEEALRRSGRLSDEAREKLQALRVDAIDQLEVSLDELAEAQDTANQAEARSRRDARAAEMNAEAVAVRELRDIVIGTMEEEAAVLARLAAARDDARERAVAAARESRMSEEDLLAVLHQIDGAYERNEQKAIKARSRQEEAGVALRDSLVSLWGTISDTISDSYDQQVEAGRVSAMKAFAVQKALALGQLAVNTAVAISNVWRDWAAQPAVAGGLTAAVGVMATTQGIAIGAQEPAFFAGGMAPDEDATRARLHRREGVLSQQGVEAVGGPEGVQRANTGRPPAPPPVWAAIVYHDRVLEMWARDALRREDGALSDIRYTGINRPGSWNPYERRR